MSQGIALTKITPLEETPSQGGVANPAFEDDEGANENIDQTGGTENRQDAVTVDVDTGGHHGGNHARTASISSVSIEQNGKAMYKKPHSNGDLKTYHDDDAFYDDEEEEEEEEELEEGEPSGFLKSVSTIQGDLSAHWKRHRSTVLQLFVFVLVCGYLCYFGYAMYHERLEHEQSIRLCWVTCVVVFFILLHYFWKKFGGNIKERMEPCLGKMSANEERISWYTIGIVFLVIVIFTVVDVFVISKNSYNLVSAAGLLFFIAFMFFFSHNPSKVKWRPVVWGLGLQFVFALFILRWDKGYEAFAWLGDRVTEFLAYANAGAAFLFGDSYMDHYFAFVVLPTVTFFSTVISALYYLGVMQAVIHKVAWVMQVCMATTAGESLNAAGNIFVGQTEAPLMVKPLLGLMTKSEIHAVMTGGFATVAGGVLAAFILMDVKANHLISASVMSAPAALAMSKLFYPETKKSKTTAKDVMNMPVSKAHNIIEAASEGASSSISLVANIAVNLIAFIALLEFVNTTLTWFGNRVGVEELTLQFIFSYLMFPLALFMGININDCRKIGMMIGIKVFLNEFLAYEELSNVIHNKEQWQDHVAANGSWEWRGDDVILYGPSSNETVLTNGFITDRSETIATYALCGFANISSIGIQLGGLGAMAPRKKSAMASLVVRAMIAGILADFLTACIAGIYYQGSDV